MIHKIKALHDNGDGLSIRAIATELGLSRNTVRKYLRMDEVAISQQLNDPSRSKQLDQYLDFIKHLLQTFPALSSVKIMRKLQEKISDLDVSDRTLRRYVSNVRKQVCEKRLRYYEPVLDMVPGVQCQVDPGELRNVMINGVETTVYFVVFVLSYSRLMHVSLTLKPIDTSEFIRMHDAAFRYFGGRTQELVYDQTKLVVIKERYRELELNARFNEYATHAGFSIRACEGYDPESKGKVEAGVKYVKQNALYGEEFDSYQVLEQHLADWLDNIANKRVHGTTGKIPRSYYEEVEQAAMQPYFTPSLDHQAGHRLTRKADKTGLISWQSNKYSVPMLYQRLEVVVQPLNGKLFVYDSATGKEITCHELHNGKGKTIKNNHHYRDTQIKITDLEQQLKQQLGDQAADELCALLKQTSPKIYKDQLAGIASIIKRLGIPAPDQLNAICQRPKLTATQFEALLEARQRAPQRFDAPQEEKITTGGLGCYQIPSQKGDLHELH